MAFALALRYALRPQAVFGGLSEATAFSGAWPCFRIRPETSSRFSKGGPMKLRLLGLVSILTAMFEAAGAGFKG